MTSASLQVSVTVPKGAQPGTQINVIAPDGQEVTAIVPDGVQEGAQMEVAYQEVQPTTEPTEVVARTMTVQVLAGSASGTQISVVAPDGQEVIATVPEGGEEGTEIEVPYEEVQIPAEVVARTMSVS